MEEKNTLLVIRRTPTIPNVRLTANTVISRDVNKTRETRDSKKFLGIEH